MLSFQCIRNTSVKIFVSIIAKNVVKCKITLNQPFDATIHGPRPHFSILDCATRSLILHLVRPPRSLRSTPSCACRIGSEHHLRRVAVRHSCNMPCPTYFSGFGYLLDTGFAVELDEPTHTVLLHTAKSCPKHSECLQFLFEHGPSFVPVEDYRSYQRSVHEYFGGFDAPVPRTYREKPSWKQEQHDVSRKVQAPFVNTQLIPNVRKNVSSVPASMPQVLISGWPNPICVN
ncbi:uncharacterized protein LOC134217717 isoform X2 [Armigeres subalbatus]|uniref:uncharacterized protein LOC134217717 isoform X2 n=1 Tax=Armigeres subalbatus TaxID=124917 RepID=UPI002ED4C28A